MHLKLLADFIVVIHFVWILFILVGFFLTVLGFFYKAYFEKWIFRTLHLIGIFYVAILAVAGKYCPLTVWENSLRAQYDPSLTYPGSFMIHYIERFIYPEVHPLSIIVPTAFIAIFTIAIYIIKPPGKIRSIFGLKQ